MTSCASAGATMPATCTSERKYGHQVASMQNPHVAQIAFHEVWGRYVDLGAVFAGRLRELEPFPGLVRCTIKRERHVVWDMAYAKSGTCSNSRKWDRSRNPYRSADTAFPTASNRLTTEVTTHSSFLRPAHRQGAHR